MAALPKLDLRQTPLSYLLSIALIGAFALLVGCSAESGLDDAQCSPDEGCPTGAECIDGYCVVTGGDLDVGGDAEPDAEPDPDADVEGDTDVDPCEFEGELAFCEGANAECGMVTEEDICGDERTVDCSSVDSLGCESPLSCADNLCECPELNPDATDEEICELGGVACGEIEAQEICEDWGEFGIVNCGGCPNDETCGDEEVGIPNVCGCPCTIGDDCFDVGDIDPNNECAVCNPDVSDEEFSNAPEDTPCEISDTCTASSCSGGQCDSSPICSGADNDCGCESCEDCTADNGWYNIGSPYDCCNAEGQFCTNCRDQEQRVYSCSGTSCTSEVVDTRVNRVACQPCGDSGNECSVMTCHEDQCVEEPAGGNAQCDDGNPCTVNECDGITCTAAPVSDGESCNGGDVCFDGNCCTPDCTDKDCGDDGCGGECEPGCDSPDECQDNQCVCIPDCDGKECGPDGCEGECGPGCDDSTQTCTDAGTCECNEDCCSDDDCEDNESCNAGVCECENDGACNGGGQFCCDGECQQGAC